MRGLGITLTTVVVVVSLVATACGSPADVDDTLRDPSSGAITERGGLGTQRLRVGDCFIQPDGTSTQVVQGVPCRDDHDSQVVALVELPEGSSARWPGVEELAERSRPLCFDSAADALDGNLIDLTVGLSAYVPDRRSWQAGDRRVVCTLGRFDGLPMTGSLLGRFT